MPYKISDDGERASLKEELARVSLLLKASTTALIALDKTGCIVHVNQRAIDLLGAQQSYLRGKPISLFIAPDDQAAFYINRSQITAGAQNLPFEINLRQKDGNQRSVRIKAQPIESPGHRLPGLLLAVDDITVYRQTLERLQFKEDLANLLFSTLDDLAAWPAADIDAIIIYALEKIGIVSKADRVYVCLFHDGKTRLSITHEWIGEGIDSPALHNASLSRFVQVLKKIKNQATVSIADINALSQADRDSHKKFHATGATSVLFTRLAYGRRLLGIIGCDAVRQPVEWPREIEQLVRCIGIAIIQALVRARTEKAPDPVRRHILQLVEPAPPAADDTVPEYDGPIEIIDEAVVPAPTGIDWQFVAETPDDPSQIDIIFLKDGKQASLACSHCNRQRKLDISEIRVLGSQLKAICVCGQAKYIKVELRREHRKTVNLRGVFMRGPGDRLALKSDDWGHIEVYNLSRRGIGFKVSGNTDIRAGDRLRVQFTLDNTAQSIIQKAVVVRSVVERMIGCEFEGQDACDVTLGFYMMT
jgi:PAS domain S-box-containing protein